jgi:hypothetical protein
MNYKSKFGISTFSPLFKFYTERICNKCICEVTLFGTDESYIIPNTNIMNLYFLCCDCYKNVDNIIFKVKNNENNKNDRYCDCCGNKFKDKDEYYSDQDLFDICLECLNNTNIKNIFIKTTNNSFIFTNREYILKYKDIELTIPDVFKDKIKKYEETYFSYINSLVKPIDINFNVLEWRLFTELDEHHYIEAYCGFIVRCVKNNHQIASIVSDDHGRVAFNIAFNSIEEYFNEKKKWEDNQNAYIMEVNNDSDSECDDDLILTVNSFPIYYRQQKNLSFYYG